MRKIMCLILQPERQKTAELFCSGCISFDLSVKIVGSSNCGINHVAVMQQVSIVACGVWLYFRPASKWVA